MKRTTWDEYYDNDDNFPEQGSWVRSDVERAFNANDAYIEFLEDENRGIKYKVECLQMDKINLEAWKEEALFYTPTIGNNKEKWQKTIADLKKRIKDLEKDKQ